MGLEGSGSGSGSGWGWEQLRHRFAPGLLLSLQCAEFPLETLHLVGIGIGVGVGVGVRVGMG